MSSQLHVDNLLTEAARDRGAAPAVWAGGAADLITFARLRRDADEVARSVTAFGTGAVIGIVADPVPAFVANYYGTIAAGAVAAPINPLMPPPAIAHVLRAGGAVAVLVAEAGLERFRAKLGATGVTGSDVPVPGGRLITLEVARPEAVPECDGVAAIMFTSGSTGRPQVCCYTHDNVIKNAQQLATAHGLGPESVVGHSRPIFYPMHMNAAVAAGATQVLAGQPDVIDSLSYADVAGTTHLYSLPVRLERLAAAPELRDVRLSHITMLGSGSTALSLRASATLSDALRVPCWQGYGLSETTSLVSTERSGAASPGTVGPAVDGMRIRVGDLDSTVPPPSSAPVGSAGRVWVQGPTVMAGYLRDGQLDDPTRDGWLDTGDYGSLDDDGMLTVLDRTSDLLHADGAVLSPSVVRRVVEVVPGVVEAAVVGDATQRAVVVAAIADGVRVGVVRAALADTAAPDARIVILPALPRLPNGKVDRSLLAAHVADAS